MELFSAFGAKGKWLLEDDSHKQIVADSLRFMVRDNRIRIFGFVLLPSEMHVLWERLPAWECRHIGQMILKFTAQQIKRHMISGNRALLEKFKSGLGDRRFQFWERGAKVTVMHSEACVREKLEQMHEAPVESGFCGDAASYRFSSAAFYLEKERSGLWQENTAFLTHYDDYFRRIRSRLYRISP